MTAQATRLCPAHPSGPAGQSPKNGHTTTNYDSLSVYAKACAKQSGQQLKVLGEAGYKYLSGAVGSWRAGSADSAGATPSPRGTSPAYSLMQALTRSLTHSPAHSLAP